MAATSPFTFQVIIRQGPEIYRLSLSDFSWTVGFDSFDCKRESPAMIGGHTDDFELVSKIAQKGSFWIDVDPPYSGLDRPVSLLAEAARLIRTSRTSAWMLELVVIEARVVD